MKLKFSQTIRDRETGELYLKRFRLLPMLVGKDGQIYYAPFNVFLHVFYRSDHDRALHDHPWPSVSFKLWGAAVEHYAVFHEHIMEERVRRIPWLLPIYRPATWTHRIELVGPAPVVTIFCVGFKQRTWGFWPKGVWKRWTEYLGLPENAHVD